MMVPPAARKTTLRVVPPPVFFRFVNAKTPQIRGNQRTDQP